MQSQDSTHPTGVAGDTPGRGVPGNAVSWSRNRKAAAAIELRIMGATWTEICATLGYPTPRAALVAVEKALVKELDVVDREQLRMLVGARLERMLRAVYPKAVDPDHPEQMPAQREARADIVEYVKLFGLAAPAEVVIHTPTAKEIAGWVGRVATADLPDVVEADIIDVDEVEDDDAVPPG